VGRRHDDAVGLRAARSGNAAGGLQGADQVGVLAPPVFCTQKLTVTVSPGSSTPLAGVQLSATRVAPALVITGLGTPPAA